MKALAGVVASRVAAEAQVAAIRAEAKDEATTARAEAEKCTKDKFWAGFFQGYTDLKRRVALVYLEWDLAAFSGVDSDH